MEKEQEKQWAEAQNIAISVDLVEAAKKHLKFLAVVDRNRHLYESPALDWAIYRYNAFWLPLLAKHLENPFSEDPLVIPLDCEWIWHCHRLNPVRYKSDCEELFGRILGNYKVISSVQGTSTSKTEEIWKQMYPEEPYELDYSRPFLGDVLQKATQSAKFTNYDLVSAVKRQVPFSFQVSRPHMSDHLFLQEALARYKGFLHIIKTNKKNGIKSFCVPTYDIDLIWHTHQLNPVYYCKDLCALMGKVLEHDDTDPDRSKGKKLDTGFSQTTKQFEETFGLRYWKAGAMYRGTTPAPVTQIPVPFEAKKLHVQDNYDDNLIQFSETKSVEVILEFVEIKNFPEAHKRDLRVSFSKKQTDKIFNAKRTLTILSQSGEKQVAYFQCEPNGEFLFEIVYRLPSNIPLPKSFKSFGSCSLSLQECLASRTRLSVDKWIPVDPLPGISSAKPILLHVSLSFTIPTAAPQLFHLVSSQPLFKGACFLPFPKIRTYKNAKNETCVTDDDGNGIFSLNMRDLSKDMTKSTVDLLKEVNYIGDSGEMHTLAEFRKNAWFIKGSHGSFKLVNASGDDGQIFELVGHKMVKLFAGRRLDFEPKQCEKQRSEQDFITAVEFSRDHPYGRAVALIDFKHRIFKVKDAWMILTGITLAYVLSDMLRTECGFTSKVGHEENKVSAVTPTVETEALMEAGVQMVDEGTGNATHDVCDGGGCGSRCGSACGHLAARCGGCGGCGGCGSMAAKCGGCGGCGGDMSAGSGGYGGCGGCGSMAAKCGGCGGGCGGGKCRGHMAARCGGCGGGCGGGKCGGCGGGHMVISGATVEPVAA